MSAEHSQDDGNGSKTEGAGQENKEVERFHRSGSFIIGPSGRWKRNANNYLLGIEQRKARPVLRGGLGPQCGARIGLVEKEEKRKEQSFPGFWISWFICPGNRQPNNHALGQSRNLNVTIDLSPCLFAVHRR